MLASGPRGNSPTGGGARPLTAARQAESPAGLPDLNEARRRPRYEPRTIPPVSSTRRRCPPANRRCNEDPAGQARPRPTPLAQPRVGQAAPVIAPATSFASFAKVSFLAVVSAALNGGRPLIGLPLSDFYGPGGGYSVTDAPPATLPFAAAPLLDPPAGLHVTSTSRTQITLSWSPVATATNYLVERATTMGGTYPSAFPSATSSFNDTGVTNVTSYLYRVCAADASNHCISPYSNLAMATAYSFDDPVIVTYADYQRDNSLTPTPIRLAHITQLREAVNAVRHLAGRPDATWTHPALVQYQSVITAADVQDLRDRLGEALSDLGVPVPVYFEQKLLTGSNGTTVKRIHITQLRDNATRGVVGGVGVASGQGTGLTGQYYGDTSLGANDYKLTRTDATVNFDWGAGSPDPSIAADNFSVHWSGVLVPLYSETYTFYTTTDDGVRLWIDGQLIVDKWVDEGPTEWSGQVSLQAGRAYSVRMEFYEHWGGASAKLQWASASQAKEVVPQSQLYPCWKDAGQYVSDFHQGVLSRQPSTSEREEWAGLLDQAEGGDQLVEQAQDLGRTLFNSQEYAARNPDQHQTADAHQYVSDLYHGYMQRDPDQSGWDYWTSQVLSAGRANVRVAFEQSAEFQEKVRRLCGTSAAARDNAGAGYDFSTARLDPDNRTGGGGADPLSRNYNWSIPLVSLPGRAGLDLGLTLSYNSLVWTKDAGGVTFDADNGWPAPGFRLGFPTIEPKFYNPQTGKYAYLLVTPSGARVELRQVGTSGVYESADSSYLQLTDGGGALTLLTTDGTRLLFAPLGGEYHCYQVEDRNGNYITAGYYSDGRLQQVTDTLGRTLTFNYDAYQNLQTITQPWKLETEAVPNPTQDTPHTWASFGYGDPLTLRPLFSNLAVIGDQPGDQIPVLRQVGLSDGSYYKFSYNDWGQVWKVTHYAADSDPASDNHALSATWLNLPGAGVSPGQAAPLPATQQTDCPRFTEERTWIQKGVMNADGEVVTSYSPWSPDMASCDTYLPDRTTVEREVYGVSWQRGLTVEAKTYSVGQPGATPSDADLRRDVTYGWEHDGAADAPYPTNPRVKDTAISDDHSNHRHTSVSYPPITTQDGRTYNLPQEVTEYGTADLSTPLRTTRTEYLDLPDRARYEALRILGLPKSRKVYAGTSSGTLMSEVDYFYDDTGNVGGDPNLPAYLQALPSPAWQHDAANYGAAFAVRGNVTRVRRYDVKGGANSFVEAQAGYNVTGTVAFVRDESGHLTGVSYADAFQPDVNRTDPNPQNQLKTFAYPTTVTDPDGFTAESWYNYDMGAATQRQTPLPNVQTNQPGPVVKSYYDAAGRLFKAVSLFNGAHTEYVYDASMTLVQSYATVADDSIQNLSDRFYSATALDGAGRARGTAHDFLSSSGPTPTWEYSAQLVYYDAMGRVAFRSNPTEAQIANGTWTPAGDDYNGGQWVGMAQTYDWKGRPLVTTRPKLNPSDPNEAPATVTASYAGCGCAGGEVVTLTDEVGRRRKVYSDSLGRQWKTEILNLDGSVYSTTEKTLNARDQATLVRQFKGGDGSGIYQDTTTDYDGYGRVQSEHTPEQDAGAATTYTYFADDTVQTVTDARHATATYAYNNRHLVTGITYGGTGITPAPPVTFDYDAAGNRLWMDDGPGRVDYTYDSLSRLQSETRALDGVGSFSFSYAYNLADQLTVVTDNTFGTGLTNSYDRTGQVSGVTGTGYGAVSQFLKGASYRAWGGAKAVTYGNDKQQVLSYDQQMRVSRATIAGLMDRSFQYYADGQVQYAHDLLNNKYDRSYGYDQVGRVTSGFSGFEARPGGVSSEGWGPYRQTYDYDTWGNMTSRTWLTWTTTPTGSTIPVSNSYSATYTNNRLTGSMTNGNAGTSWVYDGEGSLTQSQSRSTSETDTYLYGYDQAGQLVSTLVRRVTTVEQDEATQQSFDGDGQRVMFYDDLNTIDGTNHRLYFVRSTALGGQILDEVNPSGQKQRAYVYAGGEPLATQEGTGSQVRWEHRDATSAGIYWTDAAGALASHGEYDPLGVSAPDVPGITMVNNSPYNSGSFGTPDMGCNVDRIPTPCTMAQRWIASGIAVPCENNDCDPQPQRDDDGKPNGWKVPMGGGYWVSNGEKPDLPGDAFIFPDEVEWRDGGDWASWAMSFGGGDGRGRDRRRPVERRRGGRRQGHSRRLSYPIPPNRFRDPQSITQQPSEEKPLVAPNFIRDIRCEALRTLLNREKEFGTEKAARMSSIEWGGKTKLRGLDNYYGPENVGGLEVDVDWLTLLDGFPIGANQDPPLYLGGKAARTFTKLVMHIPMTYPAPFTKPGENNALFLATGRIPFSAIFNPVWMKERCPGH